MNSVDLVMARATELMAHLRAASGHLLKSSDDIKRKFKPEIKQFVHSVRYVR